MSNPSRYAKYTRISEYEDYEDRLAYNVIFAVVTPDGIHQEFVIDMHGPIYDREWAEGYERNLQRAIERLVEHEMTISINDLKAELSAIRKDYFEAEQTLGNALYGTDKSTELPMWGDHVLTTLASEAAKRLVENERGA